MLRSTTVLSLLGLLSIFFSSFRGRRTSFSSSAQ
jgi:hypothetical protein